MTDGADLMQKAVWRLRDVCRYVGCHRDTVLRAVESGELEALRFKVRRGSPWKFKRDVVLAWIDSKRVKIAS